RAVATPAFEWCRQSAEHPRTGPQTWAPRGVRPGCRLDAPPLLLDIRGEGIPGQGSREKIRAGPRGPSATDSAGLAEGTPVVEKPTGRLAQGTRGWAVTSGVNGRTGRRGTRRRAGATRPRLRPARGW